VSRITTRYIRLVDGEPTRQGAAETGDVPGPIEVGIQLQPAEGATEPVSFPSSKTTTSGAHLARVLGRHEDYFLPKGLALVSKESLELGEGPAPLLPIEILPFPLPVPEMQVLEDYHIGVHVRYLLGYAMVDIGLEPSLPARQALELPFCRAGAYRLQPPSQVRIASTDLLDGPGVKECVIRCDSDVVDATVHSNDPWPGRGRPRRRIDIDYDVDGQAPPSPLPSPFPLPPPPLPFPFPEAEGDDPSMLVFFEIGRDAYGSSCRRPCLRTGIRCRGMP
jgi:hypothetical protein